jgi:hypothetical protein
MTHYITATKEGLESIRRAAAALGADCQVRGGRAVVSCHSPQKVYLAAKVAPTIHASDHDGFVAACAKWL